VKSQPDLRAEWAGLNAPQASGGLTFATVAIPGASAARLGRSATGPALLFEISEPIPLAAPIVLKNLAVKFNALCRIEHDGQLQEGRFTVVMCTTMDTNLHEIFLDALQNFVNRPLFGDEKQITAVIGALVELFRALNRSPLTSVLGLWGELFLMSVASDCDLLLDAWHIMPNDRYDFAYGSERIEVKTTVGRRQHTFSLDQLQPPRGVELTVVSIVTESSAAGATIQDLISIISDRSAIPDAVSRLVNSAAKALGADISEWGTQRYDPARAVERLAFFSPSEVPKPVVASARVLDVRFRVDLEGIQPSPPSAIGDLRVAAARA
jgi:hypothetical protein